MNSCSAIHMTVLGLNTVVVFGNDQLKETFLPRATAGDRRVAFGITEPDRRHRHVARTAGLLVLADVDPDHVGVRPTETGRCANEARNSGVLRAQ